MVPACSWAAVRFVAASAGLVLLLRLDENVDYLTDSCPGCSPCARPTTVAPLTATVLADADEDNAGIASGVNNAIARAAGLVAIAGIGTIIAGVVRLLAGCRARLARRGPAGRRRGGGGEEAAAGAGGGGS